MSFTSLHFLIFFPVVIILFNLMPQKGKVPLLLAASYFFYINLQPIYAVLLLCVTLCTYLFTSLISRDSSEKNKKRLMILGIIVVLLPLFFFKYFGFINDELSLLFTKIGWSISFPSFKYLLPIGISFYTFMAVGYIIDVYNEEVEFEKNIFNTGLFLSFFPIILSGPIERAGNIFPQFKKIKNSSWDDISKGVKLMMWGYFMKLCVADRLCIYVDAIFNNIPNHNGTSLAFASALYPFQLYADLGGYSLIAIGVARCLGITIIENFNRPFFATSMSEFWRRWHISLIKWLTDYIYTPLSFSLRSLKITGILIALMLTFFISGIWHGAAFVFIIWGLIQGIYLCVDALTGRKRAEFEQKHNLKHKWWWILLCCICVFILFAFSQIFGRCGSMPDSLIVIKKIFTESGSIFIDMNTLINGVFCLIILLVKDFSEEFFNIKGFMYSSKPAVRYIAISALLSAILLFGVFDGNQFIYFQF